LQELRSSRLSRQLILDAALSLVDESGAEALTMRRLAETLGVAPMSLYNHVRGREELLDGLAEILVGRIGVPPSEDLPAHELLRRFATGIRTVARAHPDAFELVGMRPLRTRAALRGVETTLAALRRWGLSEQQAPAAYRALVSYARGFALAEIAGFTLEERTRRRTSHVTPHELDPGEFPAIAELSSWLSPRVGEETFFYGLDALLAGLAPNRRERPPADNRAPAGMKGG
jgi:AcrR family transcriptional regulator